MTEQEDEERGVLTVHLNYENIGQSIFFILYFLEKIQKEQQISEENLNSIAFGICCLKDLKFKLELAALEKVIEENESLKKQYREAFKLRRRKEDEKV